MTEFLEKLSGTVTLKILKNSVLLCKKHHTSKK